MTAKASFRSRLAVRFAVIAMLLAISGSGMTFMALRYVLNRRLDSVVKRLAAIEASATTDSSDESVHFHDAIFRAPGDNQDLLAPYAQVWTLRGASVARTANLRGGDLPLPTGIRERVSRLVRPELFTFTMQREEYRSYLYPLGLVGEQHSDHLLQVAVSTAETRTVLLNVLAVLGALVVVGMVAGAAAGWWLAGYAVRPVVEITRQAEGFETKRVRHRISAQSDTVELSRLVTVLNGMLSRIDDTLEGQRRFLADAGHSINTPLTVLRGDIDVALRRRRPAEEYERVLAQSLRDLKEVSTLADDLITLARSDGGELLPDLQQAWVGEVFARVAQRFRSSADRAGTALEVRLDQDVKVYADPGLLDRALGNLIDNAIKYGPDGPAIVMSASDDADGWVTLRIIDGGTGIDGEHLEKLTDRFYRGEPGQRKARGSGLGLSIAVAIVESHGGTLHIQSTPGHGTSVTLRLPRFEGADRV